MGHKSSSKGYKAGAAQAAGYSTGSARSSSSSKTSSKSSSTTSSTPSVTITGASPGSSWSFLGQNAGTTVTPTSSSTSRVTTSSGSSYNISTSASGTPTSQPAFDLLNPTLKTTDPALQAEITKSIALQAKTQARQQYKSESQTMLQTPQNLLTNVQDAKSNLAYSVALKREQEIQNRLVRINQQLKTEQDRVASRTGEQTADPSILQTQSAKYTSLLSEKEKANKELAEEKNKIVALESGNLITSAEQSFSGIQNINPMTTQADTTPMELPAQDPTQRIVEWEGAEGTIIDPKFTASTLGQDISQADQKVFTDTATLDMSSMLDQGKSLESFSEANTTFPQVDTPYKFGSGQTLEGYMDSLGKTTTNLQALDAQPVKSEKKILSDAQKKINKKIDAGMSPKDAFMVVAKQYNEKGVYLTQSGKVVQIATAPSPLVDIGGEMKRDKDKYGVDPLSASGQTVQKQYAQQFENQIKNIAQTEYFLAVREGRVGIGQALFKPKGTLVDQFYEVDGKLRTSMPQDSYDITKTYLEERGMSMDTPVGMIKTSPMVYEEAKSQVEKYMTGETKEMGYLEPPKDRDWTKPPQQPDGTFGWDADFQPYTTTPQDRVKELTKQAFSGAVDEEFSYYQPSEFDSVGMETTPPESVAQTRGELKYGKQTEWDYSELESSGTAKVMPEPLTTDETTTSQLSSMSMFPEAMASSEGAQMTTPPPVEAGKDWLGGEIADIPDDPFAQMAKGFTAEAFNITQAGTGMVTGKEVEYAPTLFGGLMESVAQAGEGIQYKEYDSWFKSGFGNIGTGIENLGIFVDKAQKPEWQEKFGENLGKLGADIQKYPVYYASSGLFEIGTLFIPVGKIGLGARIGAEVLKIGTTGTKGQKFAQLKNVISDIKYADEKRVLATVQQVVDPKATIKIESGGIFLGLGKKKVVTTVGELTPQELKIAQTSGKINIDDLILNPNLKRSPGVQAMLSDLPKLDKQTLEKLTSGFDNMPLLTVKPKVTKVSETSTIWKTDKKGKPYEEKTTVKVTSKESADIIEQAGKGQYFMNLGIEGADPGMAVMVIKTSKAEPYPTGFISKEFDPVKVPDEMIVGGAGKPEQLGTVTWVKKGLFGADAPVGVGEAGIVQRTIQKSVTEGFPETAEMKKMGGLESIIDPKFSQTEKWAKLGDDAPTFIEQPIFPSIQSLKKTFPSQDPTTYGTGLAGQADKVKPGNFGSALREQLKSIFGRESISYGKIQSKIKRKENKLIELQARLGNATKGSVRYGNLLTQIRKLNGEIKVLESAESSAVFKSTKAQDFEGLVDPSQYKQTADIVQFTTVAENLPRGADNIFTSKIVDLGTGNLKVTLPKGADPKLFKKLDLGKPFDLSPPGSPSSPKVIQTAKEIKPDKPLTDIAKTKAVLKEQAGIDTVPFRVTDYTPIPAPAISPMIKMATPTITSTLPKIDTTLGTGLIPDLSIKTDLGLGIKTVAGLDTGLAGIQSMKQVGSLATVQGLKITQKLKTQKKTNLSLLMPRYVPPKTIKKPPRRAGILPFGNIFEKDNWSKRMADIRGGRPIAKMIWAAPETWFDAEGYYYKGKKGEQTAFRMMGRADDPAETAKKALKRIKTITESRTIQTQLGDPTGTFKF